MRPQLDDLAARLDGEAVLGGERGERPGERLEQAGLEPAGVHGDGEALVLHAHVIGSALGQPLRQAGGQQAHRGRRLGHVRLAGGGVPPLGSVLPGQHERLQADTSGEPAELERLTDRAPGDDRDLPDQRTEPGQRLDGVLVREGGGGVVDHMGERAVEVEGEQRAGGIGYDRVHRRVHWGRRAGHARIMAGRAESP